MSVAEKLRRSGPRRLLALDGGGIRGLVSIEVLAAMERQLQQALGRDDRFVLADYFDYVAGTSTGAIIGSCISLGMRVDQIRRFYVDSAAEMFARARLRERLRHRYVDRRLAERLRQEFGSETVLGSERLRTLLLLVMRNASTDSPWPVSNNPRAMFNEPDRGDSNLAFPLWQIVRASTAAPSYFPPEVIEVEGRRHVFVDGGVTAYNNPAFLLFLMATTEPYRLMWPVGEGRMLLVSIGTGRAVAARSDLRPTAMHLLYHASTVPAGLISAAVSQQDLLCRTFGRCLVGDEIDQEVGTMIDVRGPFEPRLFTYLRYDADLSRPGLDRLGLAEIRPEEVAPLDAVGRVAELRRVGEAVAAKVRPEHFAGFLDGWDG